MIRDRVASGLMFASVLALTTAFGLIALQGILWLRHASWPGWTLSRLKASPPAAGLSELNQLLQWLWAQPVVGLLAMAGLALLGAALLYEHVTSAD